VDATPADHLQRAVRLSNQGLALLARFDSLSKASDLDLALTRLHQAVAAAPDGWPGRATVLRNLGSALRRQGQLATAEDLLRESLAEQERSLGPDHPDTISTLSDLAGVLAERDLAADAEAVLDEVVVRQERTLGPDHPAVAAARERLRLMPSGIRTGDVT
jgi:tetratricopeptide (TPR) repeat protein